ncbi:MAG: hypothetical protein K2W96_08280 [Gemmataceae bacterium]|nr:hypothetical protein [Gemmataceae bacterium]
MAVRRCPRCSTPLTEDEALAPACPMCGEALQAPAPPAPEAKPAPPAAPSPWGWIAAVSALSALALGLWLARPLPALPVPVEKSEEYRTLLEAKNRADARVADLPRQAGKARAALEKKLEERGRELDEERGKRVEAEKRLGEALAKLADAEKRATEALEVVRLDKAAGTHRVESLRDGEKLRLAGRIGTLHVVSVEGAAVLDARGLTARVVVIERSINGKAKVFVNAPSGVVMLPTIAGGAEVEADAPKGRVSVRGVGSGSKVRIKAREAQFGGSINGTGTEVRVTLSKHGALNFDQLASGSRLLWKKENPGDPMPRLGKGAVRDSAQFAEER